MAKIKKTTNFDSIKHTDKRKNIPKDIEPRKNKRAKAETARALWIPAVNNHGAFGCWTFIEVNDPWDEVQIIRNSANQTRTKGSVKWQTNKLYQ